MDPPYLQELGEPAPVQSQEGPAQGQRLLAALRTVFGHAEFRPLQREIVGATLRGEDVFVLMPTGGGKSLCYQLPALLLDGLTVVVSPLIALMKDQVDRLRALGFPATFINSSLEPREIVGRQAAIVRGEVKVLYVAPERLMAPGFLRFLSTIPIARFTIDEAHCISEWGHDFRPEYRELARLRELFPSTRLSAFTATATRRVQADIMAQLGLEKASTFRGSFNRPNLFYEVQPKHDPDQQLAAYLRGHADACGIVYCQTRAETERVASMLQTAGFSAGAYHAGLQGEERKRRQEAFIKDDTRIIVATIAFGMGIDKPDVRFVIHYDLPKSLEGYFQESGRAGRDGDPSDCILFYSHADVARHEYFIKQKPSPQEQVVARQQLRQIADWAESALCRRRALLAYFDEPFEGQPGRCCDVCRDPSDLVDCTIPAQMLLSCVKRTGERFGIAYVIDLLRGSRGERVIRLGHDKLSTYGIGRDRPKDEWQHLARQLLQQGYIRQEGEFNVVKVTDRGHRVLFRGEQAFLAPSKRMPSGVPLRTARRLATTARRTLELFNEGRSPAEIAVLRKLAPSTVERHVAEAIETGDLLDLGRLVSEEKRRSIEQALAEVGSELLAPIREYLGDGYTYSEIHYVRAALHHGPTVRFDPAADV